MGFPSCTGAINGTHAHSLPSAEHENINHKEYYSIVIQALITPRAGSWAPVWNVLARCMMPGFPGDHDFTFIDKLGTFTPKNTVKNEVTVPTVILGDTMYFLLPWLMTLHPDLRGPGKRKLNSCRMVVEYAFDRLQSTWQCLQNHLDTNAVNVICITVACSILHNICGQR